jgi:hypothetical protein
MGMVVSPIAVVQRNRAFVPRLNGGFPSQVDDIEPHEQVQHQGSRGDSGMRQGDIDPRS